MGHELYRMILGGAPASWTPAMRLVAAVIADDAKDPSQGLPSDGGWPWSAIRVSGHFKEGEWHDGLAERTGLGERTISRALTDLARSGYEMREQIGTDKRGQPVFAYPSRAMRFRVPLLSPRPCPPDMATITAGSPPGPATARHAMVARSGNTGRQIWQHWSPDMATQSPQVSSESPQRLNGPVVNSSLERARDGETGDIEAERRRQEKSLAEWIRDHPQPPESTSAESIEGETTP